MDEESVLIVVDEFHRWQTHDVVLKNQMDDDCQRGMFRAYHVITSLMRYEASNFASKGKSTMNNNTIIFDYHHCFVTFNRRFKA